MVVIGIVAVKSKIFKVSRIEMGPLIFQVRLEGSQWLQVGPEPKMMHASPPNDRRR